ncbi:hypothetical protein LTR62_006111 [Meristemomyces frigidus]|uniref:Uncharacterized protein n=1 Tax=Meristemomyces frigidus TaxID=1508187 RepID=A0AAN7YIS7_9PEZI|nr:hypothetical protein LTR62_006111 [Meristemomyces frigidus]
MHRSTILTIPFLALAHAQTTTGDVAATATGSAGSSYSSELSSLETQYSSINGEVNTAVSSTSTSANTLAISASSAVAGRSTTVPAGSSQTGAALSTDTGPSATRSATQAVAGSSKSQAVAAMTNVPQFLLCAAGLALAGLVENLQDISIAYTETECNSAYSLPGQVQTSMPAEIVVIDDRLGQVDKGLESCRKDPRSRSNLYKARC